jgi:hypothetical protein
VSDCPLPATVAELLIDDGPRFHFVEIDRLCRLGGFLRYLLNRSWRRSRSGLQLCQLCGKNHSRSVRFGGKLFPNSPILLLLSRALLGRETRALMLLGFGASPLSRRLGCGKLLAQPRQLGVQRYRRSRGIWRRDKLASLKSYGLAKGAVKPDAQLPRDLQPGQRFAMRTRNVVRGAVACDPQLIEEIADLSRVNSLEVEPTQQVGLWLFGRSVETSFRGDELGQHLAKLPELNQARIRIIAKVALRQGA